MDTSPKLAVYSLGCRANQFDSESIVAQFKKNGYTRVPEFSNADVHVINTCTVTNNGDYKGRQLIKKVLKLNQGKVLVTGCSAQQDADVLSDLGVDLVVDNANKDQIFSHFENHEFGDKVTSNILKETEFKQTPIEDFGEKTRAHLKIQDGCNQYCTYCIIPFVRGRSRSIDPINALEQLQVLVNKGYKEIVITGIHVGYFESENLSFTGLLEQILNVEGDFRIRLSSIEPREINDELLKLFKRFPEKLCRHLHIAIQSASNSVLENMRRPYTVEYLKDTFDKLYQLDSNFGIGLDVIVGFPGETEVQFLETCEFVKSYPISYGHVFRFSPKVGTPAARFSNQIPEGIKKHRSRRIREIMDKQEKSYLQSQAGTFQNLILEDEESGCTQYFTHVKLDKPVKESSVGKNVRVQIHSDQINLLNSKFTHVSGSLAL